jgi:hypothetical protein
MDALIIQPKSKKELAFISEMLKRLNIKSKIMSDEEKEDYALGRAIEEGMKTNSVSKTEVLKHLRK